MSNSFTAVKQPAKLIGAKASGRGFVISMKGIPRVDAKEKARLEAAARSTASRKRSYPIVAL